MNSNTRYSFCNTDVVFVSMFCRNIGAALTSMRNVKLTVKRQNILFINSTQLNSIFT